MFHKPPADGSSVQVVRLHFFSSSMFVCLFVWHDCVKSTGISPTGMQRISACSCISNLLDVIPPSTWSWVNGMPLSWFMASSICDHTHTQTSDVTHVPAPNVTKSPRLCQIRLFLTSRVWKQTASSAAKATWLLLVNWVRPHMILWHRTKTRVNTGWE